MPRFVILAHDWPYPHFDFLLEDGLHLRSWRLESFPRRGVTIPASMLPEHRLIYLNFEGPLTGERGTVLRNDWGTFEWIERTTEVIRVELHGRKINGPAEWRPDHSMWQF
jgi:hypothetical protein